MIRKLLFRLARSRVSALFIGTVFEHGSSLIPVQRIAEERYVLTFSHPSPYWAVHYLAVPKKRIRTLAGLDLRQPVGQSIMTAILRSLQQAANRKSLREYQVLVNGGTYQDVPQLHFHLASGAAQDGPHPPLVYRPPLPDSIVQPYQSAIAYLHPNPARAVHYLITGAAPLPDVHRLDLADLDQQQAVLDCIRLAQQLVSAASLPAYTLVVQGSLEQPDPTLAFHLVSGRRLPAGIEPR